MQVIRTLFAAVLALLSTVSPAQTEKMTPLLLSVHDAPVPFAGSDGRTHLVYELWILNYSSADSSVQKVDVLDGDQVLQSLTAAEIAAQLQPAGKRVATATLTGGLQALLFLDVPLAPGATVPSKLTHRVTGHFDAAPPAFREITATGGETTVDRRVVVHIAPPLRGDGYISADSSCSSTRHRRAALPVNERLWIAQRFAVDWEQLNSTGHIYSGPPKDTSSYTIYGKTVYAVADATVESVIDNQPEQVPGTYPSNITLDQADGNSVILKLADRTYALYAHMQPGSIRVRAGQQVKIGDVIGLVGNTGNSVAPHLHFQVMDAPSSLGSNGLPYAIDSFVVTGSTPGTAAFDESESKGVPLAFTKAASTASTRNALPLDQLIVSFSSPK